MANKRFIMLSCDGGGVRGLITAKLLQTLDPAFLQSVSLFAGTSTGSIIALGLAAGVPIDQIVEIYRSMSNCNAIFTPYVPALEASAKRARFAEAMQAARPTAVALGDGDWWDEIWALIINASQQLAFPKYKSDGLRALLTKNLPALTLAQLADPGGKYVVVPSFQITPDTSTGSWKPALFHNLPNLSVTPELSATMLVDAAMCSAAAPLFFPPHTLSSRSYIDGGVFANNPSSTAIAAYLASSEGAAKSLDPASFAAVSIGTGNVANSYPPSGAVLPYGILGWMYPYESAPAPAFPLIQAMFDGGSAIDDLVSRMILRNSTYIRANPVFKQTWSLDDCSSLDQMNDLTDDYIKTPEWRKKKTEIDALAHS